MQVSTTFVGAEVKSTQRGQLYRFKEASGAIAVTNDQQLAALAQSLLNQPVLADINEVTSQNVNPHTGRPYINRYLNSVVAAGAPVAPPQTFAAPQATGASFHATPDVSVEITANDRSIWMQSGSKVAAKLLEFFPEGERTLKTFDNLVQREVEKYEAAHKGAPALFAAAGVPAQDVTDQFATADDIPF